MRDEGVFGRHSVPQYLSKSDRKLFKSEHGRTYNMGKPIDFSKMLKGVPASYGSNLSVKIGNPPKLKTRKSLCMWSDLLGFGNIYSENNWELNDKQKHAVYDRLLAAHSAVLYYSTPFERNMILNDGIAKVYMPEENAPGKGDINLISIYFRHCIELHLAITQTEKAKGFPGCRSVIAFGDCIEYLAEEVKFDDYVMNYTKPEGQEISSIAKRVGNPTMIYNPKELQMNTAFSKAYILESGGSKAGLPGNNLYIDQSVINAVITYGEKKRLVHVWQELDDELRLLIPYEKDNLNEVAIGFAFDKNVITPKVERYSTKVYKLLKLFPYDEPVDEFCFDLIND